MTPTLRQRRAIYAIFVVAIMGLTIWGATLAGAHSSSSTTFKLKEKNDSGISGSGTYSNSRIKAKATGFDPDKNYYSFIYGAGSDADGSNPCILTGERVLPNQVNVGKWKIDSDGNGTLSAEAPVPVKEAGTLSIREDPLDAGGTVPLQPITYPLVACADIGKNQNTTLGNVQNQAPNIATPKLPLDSLQR